MISKKLARQSRTGEVTAAKQRNSAEGVVAASGENHHENAKIRMRLELSPIGDRMPGSNAGSRECGIVEAVGAVHANLQMVRL